MCSLYCYKQEHTCALCLYIYMCVVEIGAADGIRNQWPTNFTVPPYIYNYDLERLARKCCSLMLFFSKNYGRLIVMLFPAVCVYVKMNPHCENICCEKGNSLQMFVTFCFQTWKTITQFLPEMRKKTITLKSHLEVSFGVKCTAINKNRNDR